MITDGNVVGKRYSLRQMIEALAELKERLVSEGISPASEVAVGIDYALGMMRQRAGYRARRMQHYAEHLYGNGAK